MKKINWKNVILILLPVLAVGLATTVDSVMVFDSVSETTVYYSYFDLIPDNQFAVLMPLAGILSGVCGVLAAVFMVRRSQKLMKAIAVCSFCAATFAVLPILLKGEVTVVPNVGLPLFMMIEWFVSYMMLKKPQLTEEVTGNRLKDR